MATGVARRITSRLQRQVVRTIRDRQLFALGAHLLVAVSGGPDSTALLMMMARLAPSWRLKLTAVHVNYRLRGTESDGDETFVSSLCGRLGIRLVTCHPILKKRRGQSSIQALARDLRYTAMKDVAKTIGADRIVVGHTADDQAETILLWMLRGAGLSGLAGMPYLRDGVIVRPLLSSTRAQLLKFLQDEGLSYRQDSSNRSLHYRRNRIRHELLPLLRQIAPGGIEALLRQAELLRADEECLEEMVVAQWPALVQPEPGGSYRIDRRQFLKTPAGLQRRLIRRLWREFESEGRAPSSRVVEAVRRFASQKSSGQELTFRDVVLRRHRAWVAVSPRLRGEERSAGTMQAAAPVIVTVPSTIRWAGTDAQFHVQVLSGAAAAEHVASRSCRTAVFDADLVVEPLVMRGWRAGDRIAPIGMAGKRKKLQDLFTDAKIPRSTRAKIPVFADAEGVLWVAGVRQDERCSVRQGTARCLVMTMQET